MQKQPTSNRNKTTENNHVLTDCNRHADLQLATFDSAPLTLTLYDPIYFIGATEVGTFLLSSQLNNT